MINRLIIALVVVLASTSVFARGVDMKLSGETAELIYLTEAATFGYGGADIGIGLFFNDVALNANILVSGSGTGESRSWQYGVGGKLYVAKRDIPSETGGAIGIGGMVRYVFPASMPFAVLGEGYFAPEVTSFADADGFREIRVAGELEVTPSARAYIGVRRLEMILKNGANLRLDNEAHIGVRFTF